MCNQHNAVQNCNIKLANKPFENVTKFKNLGTGVTNQHYIHEIESRLNSRRGKLNIEEFCNLSSDTVNLY
jgi:hypothetical protein